MKLEEDLKHESFVQLSCRFLCLPFALDLTSHNTSRILQLFDSCGVVGGLLQVKVYLCCLFRLLSRNKGITLAKGSREA